jgi:hypothetical protein
MVRTLRGALAARRSERRRRALADHRHFPLVFDPGWYVTRYRDVFRVGADPLDHLLRSGLKEGRDPGPYVDLSFAATQLAGEPPAGAELLRHLLDSGLPSGVRTSPYVDLDWYARRYGDVPEDPMLRFAHLVGVGPTERRDPSPFVDLGWFTARHRDVEHGGLDPFAYFVALGGPLGRFPHPLWDEDSYVGGNEYVRFALGMGKYLHGFEHFCAVGHVEVARGAETLFLRMDDGLNEYSEERYLTVNPDVAEAVAAGTVRSGVAHLFGGGHAEVADGRRRLRPSARRSGATATPGDRQPGGAALLILVHFDPDGLIDPHVRLAMDTFDRAGFDICAVSVDAQPEALADLRERSIAVLHRDVNDPLRDFGAWQLALDWLGPERLAGYELVVLANDSAYFPACDPTEFLTALREQRNDLWGASDSISGGRYHLQSFFLALRGRGLTVLLPEIRARVDAFSDPTKLSLIQHFEVGLTQFALEQGLTVGAYRSVAALPSLAESLAPPDPRELSSLVLTITNQTHHFWRSVLASGLPFLKVELLRDNPLEVDLTGWETILEAAPCSTLMVRRHLDRVSPRGWAGQGSP